MKTLIGLLVIFLLSCVMACGDIKNDLSKAKTLKIIYTLKRERKSLTIDDEKQIRQIISTIDVESTDKGIFLFSQRFGIVEITVSDDKTEKLYFDRPAQIERAEFGQLYLKDDKFYKKINEILSKKEGREMDVLKDN
jgi:hypothetical protein